MNFRLNFEKKKQQQPFVKTPFVTNGKYTVLSSQKATLEEILKENWRKKYKNIAIQSSIHVEDL